jgi:hypothetical protein
VERKEEKDRERRKERERKKGISIVKKDARGNASEHPFRNGEIAAPSFPDHGE